MVLEIFGYHCQSPIRSVQLELRSIFPIIETNNSNSSIFLQQQILQTISSHHLHPFVEPSSHASISQLYQSFTSWHALGDHANRVFVQVNCRQSQTSGNTLPRWKIGSTTKVDCSKRLKNFMETRLYICIGSLRSEQNMNMILNLISLQVPAFEDSDGNCIYESNAIAYYGKFNFQVYFNLQLLVEVANICDVSTLPPHRF